MLTFAGGLPALRIPRTFLYRMGAHSAKQEDERYESQSPAWTPSPQASLDPAGTLREERCSFQQRQV